MLTELTIFDYFQEEISLFYRLHSVVHGVTVAIFMKMRNLQFCLLLWLSNDAPRLKKVVEPNRTSGGCAGAACQLLPGGD